MKAHRVIAGLAVVACSSTGPKPGTANDAHSGGESVDSSTEGPREQVPAELGEMMKRGPCTPKVRTPLEQHVLTRGDGAEDAPQAFIMGIDERLCVVSEPAATEPRLSAETVDLSRATDALISVETRATSIGAVMVIHNHHSRPLRYRAFIRPVGRELQPTSVCPVRSDVPTIEHWPYEIDTFSFGDFQLLDAGSDMACY